MTIEEVKNKFFDIIHRQNNLKGRVLDTFSEPFELYLELYGEYPEEYFVSVLTDREKMIENLKKQFNCFIPESFYSYKERTGEIVFEKEIYMDNILTPEGIITVERGGFYVYSHIKDFKDKVFKCFEKVEEEIPCQVYWVSQSDRGFTSSKLVMKKALFNINSHYNDDFKYDKVTNFINSEESGLIILHGIPGTGKTFIIRHLAQTNPEKRFYFMDKSTFGAINSHSFVSFLLSNAVKDSVFVLEDCEVLLADRMETGNHLLSTILNLSDGVLGDGLNIKFICTFNADLTRLDKAVLRKGRLKYKYEFKELSPNKTQELAKELKKNIPNGKSLTVGDIYNWDDETGAENNKAKKIGF